MQTDLELYFQYKNTGNIEFKHRLFNRFFPKFTKALNIKNINNLFSYHDLFTSIWIGFEKWIKDYKYDACSKFTIAQECFLKVKIEFITEVRKYKSRKFDMYNIGFSLEKAEQLSNCKEIMFEEDMAAKIDKEIRIKKCNEILEGERLLARRIFDLRYKHEWDIEDICKKMRMSSNAVWFHIYKTMELLKKQI